MNKITAIRALNDMSEDEWRFWAKVDTSGECWNWRAAKLPTGYGVFALRGKTERATRVVWLFVYGELLSEDIVIRHKCNNPACVNPSHLLTGTHADNVNDKVKSMRVKGRGPVVGKVGADSIRLEYQQGGITQSQLAQKYNITLRSIQAIINNHTYSS